MLLMVGTHLPMLTLVLPWQNLAGVKKAVGILLKAQSYYCHRFRLRGACTQTPAARGCLPGIQPAIKGDGALNPGRRRRTVEVDRVHVGIDAPKLEHADDNIGRPDCANVCPDLTSLLRFQGPLRTVHSFVFAAIDWGFRT